MSDEQRKNRKDVSARASAVVIEVLERWGRDCAALGDGTDLTLGDFRRARRMLTWDDFACFLRNVGHELGGDEALVELGRAICEAPSWEFPQRLTRFAISPQQALRYATAIFAPAVFPCIEHDYRESPASVDLELRLPASYAPSREFFLISRGQLAAWPRMMGLPDAIVSAELTDRSGSYHIRLPASQSLPSRMFRWGRALAGAPQLLARVLEQQQELERNAAIYERSRQDLTDLIDRLPDGVALEREGKLVYANPALCRAVGRGLDELVGQSVLTFVLAADHQWLQTRMRERDAHAAPRGDIRVVRPDESIRVFAVEPGQWVDYAGERVRLVILRDVTKAREQEAQLMQSDRMASLGTLAAGVAHEINNPLAWLYNSLRAIERDLGNLSTEAPPPEETLSRMQEALSAAVEGTARVRTIVRDLKTFSRPDDESIESVDVRGVLRGAIRVSRKEVSHRARLDERYEDVPRVLGNSARLGQVFLNLIVNAAQAVDPRSESEPVVAIRTFVRDESVVVEVRDSGRGIPSHLLPRIFEPFFTTKVGEGTGLGLAISHRIVTRLGGQIEVESVEREGTVFRVLLPMAPQERVSAPRHDAAQ